MYKYIILFSFLFSCQTKHVNKMKYQEFTNKIKSLELEKEEYSKLLDLNNKFVNISTKKNFDDEQYSQNFIKYCEDEKVLNLNTLLILKNNFQSKYVYKLTGENIKDSYLVPIIHLGDQYHLTDYIEKCEVLLNECDTYIMESIPDEEGIFKEMCIDIFKKITFFGIDYKLKPLLEDSLREIKSIQERFYNKYPNSVLFPHSCLHHTIGIKNLISPDIQLYEKALEKKLDIKELDLEHVPVYIEKYKNAKSLGQNELYKYYNMYLEFANSLLINLQKFQTFPKLENNVFNMDPLKYINNKIIKLNKEVASIIPYSYFSFSISNYFTNCLKKFSNRVMDWGLGELCYKFISKNPYYEIYHSKKVKEFHDKAKELEGLIFYYNYLSIIPNQNIQKKLIKLINEDKIFEALKIFMPNPLYKITNNLISEENFNNNYKESYINQSKETKDDINKRNSKWMDIILHLIQNKKIFITCGSAHIYDLIKKLENKSVGIERIDLNNNIYKL